MGAKEGKQEALFVKGAISPAKIGDMIARHQSRTSIGAHDIFIGQIRADEKEGSRVAAIVYTAYEDMAFNLYHEIREAVFEKYKLSCMHVMHSLGEVRAGEISLLVFVSAPHRQDCFDACRMLVERIKKELPVWGKEVFENETSSWKVNT